MDKKYHEITAITDAVCNKYISDEYAEIIRKAAHALCCLSESPIRKGTAKTWACGITHAIGMVNFLFDNSQQPYISAADLYKHFAVSQSSGQAKSKITRDALSMTQMDSEWSTRDRINENPFTWLFEINGKIVDVRKVPITLQRSLFEKGLIPFIPGDKLRT
ncbi:MAG: hypothetical protein GKR94_03190 [Gammaproteobacteria bacterium]|nr:hypothetical protein [Gammaproteobacteria bacterium]